MLGTHTHQGGAMATRICVSVLALALASAPVMAAVKGQCTYKGKNIAYVDGVAAMAPDPFEETQLVPTIWFVAVPFAAGELSGKKPKEIDGAVTQHSFDKDSSSLQLRLDKDGKVVEGLQLYVPPGTSYSSSSNEVGKLAMKGPFSAKAAGSWTLDDDDIKCNLGFDLGTGVAGKAAVATTPAPAAKPWGAPLPAGGGAPGATYMAMHKAALSGDVNAMIKLATKERAAEMEKSRKQPEFAGMIELTKAMEPAEVHVVSGQANATKAELQIAGKESDGATMKGTATLMNEGGAWKIEKVDTSSSMGK
jgi:hypothetical protein